MYVRIDKQDPDKDPRFLNQVPVLGNYSEFLIMDEAKLWVLSIHCCIDTESKSAGSRRKQRGRGFLNFDRGKGGAEAKKQHVGHHPRRQMAESDLAAVWNSWL